MTEGGPTCTELVEIVTEYFEGTLPAGERRRLEEHLVMCPGCRAYLEQMRETVRLAGSLREEHVPVEGREALLQAFRDWKRA